MRSGVAPSWEDPAWLVVFSVVMPALWYAEAGWWGVVLYVLILGGLAAAARFAIAYFWHGLRFWSNEPR